MDRYCERHPSQRMTRKSYCGVYTGDECPICESEKRDRDDRLREEFRARRQEEHIRQEKEEDMERKFLRDGLIEFDNAFQSEWESVARISKSLETRYEQVMEQAKNELSTAFAEMISEETLPEDIVRKADNKYAIHDYQDDVTRIHRIAVSCSAKTTHMEISCNNTVQLLNILKYYTYNSSVFTTQEVPSSGKGLLISSIALAFFGVTCNSFCGGEAHITKLSFMTVVFLWPSILLILLYIIRTFHRQSISKRIATLEPAITELASLLSAKILGRKWTKPVTDNESEVMEKVLVDITERNVFAKVNDEIYDYLWKLYLCKEISENSSLQSGRSIYRAIASDTKHSSFEDFMNDYNKYNIQYVYMRNTIIDVGKEILHGHRVPSRMKAKRIELLRCPSCGGPLARDGKNVCYYCGSQYNTIL